jgi:hypothetical protein
MERASQQKTIELDRGLFLIRYSTADDMACPPTVKILLRDAGANNVTFVLHPDHRDAVLWEPNAALVIRATSPAKLFVEVTSLYENGSVAASVKIEPLTQGKTRHPAPMADEVKALDLHDFRVLGHIARIGDVSVGSKEWLAGPSAPSRIEGISIDWSTKPRDLEIRYSVKPAKSQAGVGQVVGLGTFAGTRGRAVPLIGVSLEMSGAAASNCQFVVEAIFLGSAISRMTGKRIALSGPTGAEPLVGLRIGIEQTDARPAVPQLPVGQPSSRVRVFRSRTKRNQTNAP